MKKYLKIWWRIIKIRLMIGMMYKLDWLMCLFPNLLYVLVYFMFFDYIFLAGGVRQIAGHSQSDFLLLLCFSEILLHLAFINIIPSVHKLAIGIYEGKLDSMLTKPVNPMLFVIIHDSKLAFAMSGIVVDLCLLIVVYAKFQYSFSFYEWILILWVLCVSYLVYALMFYIASLIWFFWPKFNALRWFLGNIYDITKIPEGLYPDILQKMLLVIVPIFLVVNPIYDVIAGQYNWNMVGLTVGVLMILLLVFLIMFKKGLERYESVS